MSRGGSASQEPDQSKDRVLIEASPDAESNVVAENDFDGVAVVRLADCDLNEGTVVASGVGLRRTLLSFEATEPVLEGGDRNAAVR